MQSSAATTSRTEEGPLEALKKSTVGYAIAVVGALVALAGAFADTLGIGAEGADGMGGKQLALLLGGVVVLGAGLAVVYLASQGSSSPTAAADDTADAESDVVEAATETDDEESDEDDTADEVVEEAVASDDGADDADTETDTETDAATETADAAD
jgi:hypothetical protein